MPRIPIPAPLSDATCSECACACHDTRLVSGEGSLRDVRIEAPPPMRLSFFESAHPTLARPLSTLVAIGALTACPRCAPDHRASGVGIMHTYDRDDRFAFDPLSGCYTPRLRFRTLDGEGDEG